MNIVFSTASLEGRLDQAAALSLLRAAELRPIELGERPGEPAKADAAIVAAHLAFLPPTSGRVNLGSADDDLRRRGVQAIGEALARCEWLGIPFYQIEAGWNLDQTLPHTLPAGSETDSEGAAFASRPSAERPHALAQLQRSLDWLAGRALDKGIRLGVINMPPDFGGLLVSPAEIQHVLRTIGAPNLGLSLDLSALAAAARWSRGQAKGRFDPDEAAAGLRDSVCAIRVPRWDVRPEIWMVQVAAAAEGLPLILGATASTPAALRSMAQVLEEALHAPA